MKRSKKKSLSLIVAFCMLCMCMVNVAFADDTDAILDVTVVVSDAEAVMTVSIPEGAGVSGGSIKMTYDTDYLTLTSYDAGEVGATLNNALITEGFEGKLNASIASLSEVSGVVFTATFTLEQGTFEESYIEFTTYSLADNTSAVLESLTTVTPVVTVEEAADTADASEADASEADASEADASEADASEADASEADASEADASEADASEADASEADASEADASEADASEADASENDNASEVGDFNGIVLVMLAVVALVGCVVAKKKAIF